VDPDIEFESRPLPHTIGTLAGSRKLERLPTVIVIDHGDLTKLLTHRIVEAIEQETARKGHCVLGLATGSTPIGIYRELIRRYERGEVDFSNVITFNLDEYYPMAPDSIHSYRRYMMENLFSHVNIDPANIHIPDGSLDRKDLSAHCEAYEEAIQAAGGIDFQILGIGRSGHIGFNEPGSSPDSRTGLITLDTVTRRDAASDFFGEANVPTEAITMGIATILNSRRIALVATGEHKSGIVKRAVEGDISPDVSATHLQQHSAATVYLDPPAAAELTRVKTPWMLESVKWTPSVTERAVVWLAERANKAILKLSAADYRDNHLSPLLAKYSKAGQINGEIFNALTRKIMGKAKLAGGKRVLVFSPHPDDDVISMGGVLRKLRENENEITVAYMTSGNIAVFDHDVCRHLSFVERAAESLDLDPQQLRDKRRQIEDRFKDKKPGDVDSETALDIKRFIRESEAISAITSLGLPPSAARFLNLPFYRTGEVRKRPIGEEDIAILLALLDETRPEIVFAAGDLSDPHGTHRVCKEAIAQALARYSGDRPEVWYYRGSWQEWSLVDADVLVPLSQEELRAKILAIFKHQSQKDVALFPGGHDDREFWERVEARNLETAARADRLGMAEYYALEAYRVEVPGDEMPTF
jgi:glucosamine-6-phosphate deaminase